MSGGGIYINSFSPTIRFGTLDLTRSTVTGNTASMFGTGVC